MKILLPEETKIVSDIACRHLNLPATSLHSRSREEWVARPRQIVFYLLRTVLGAGTSAIARVFEKDPGTVSHGCGAIQNLIDSDPKFAATVAAIKAECVEALRVKDATTAWDQAWDAAPNEANTFREELRRREA